MNFGSWNMSNIKNESVVIPIALYSEKIADNDRKIEQLSKNIKRDTEKRKKLMEENARLSYQAICEQWGCTGQDLLDILSREHQQAEMLQTSGLSDAQILLSLQAAVARLRTAMTLRSTISRTAIRTKMPERSKAFSP